MQTNTKTRTQRRLEKRQTIILLSLLLLVSLVSFVLGVTTGRRGAERDFAHQLEELQETVRIVQVPVAVPESAPAASRETVPGSEVADPLIDAVVESARLSFYDDLARESTPLGSGINQPPPVADVEQPAAQPPLDLADQPIVVRGAETGTIARATPPVQQQTPPPAATPTAEQILPPVADQGTHVVQVGSFGSATDAASLRQTMIEKGYPAFLAEADLGERGIWYRVRIGPYADATAAGAVRQIIHDKEQIEGLVTRHSP